MHQPPKYDILILGVIDIQGIGALLTSHFQKFCPEDIRWAISGRRQRREEMEKLIKGGRGGEIEICDNTKESLVSLVRKSRIVVNLRGPYAEFRDVVIETCARGGVGYLDVTSEITWLKSMIERYHDIARESGAVILSSLGSTAPQDILTLCAVTELRQKLNLKTKEAISSTSQSSPQKDSKPRHRPSKNPLNPFLLSPIQSHPSESRTNIFNLRKDPILGLLTPCCTENEERIRAIVHRSWGVYQERDEGDGKGYGERFQWNGYKTIGNTFLGLRSRLGKPEIRENPQQLIRTIAIADQEGPFPDRALASLSYVGDRTQLIAVLIAQGALLLVERFERGEDGERGGILTAGCLGREYIERLREVGVVIDCELV